MRPCPFWRHICSLLRPATPRAFVPAWIQDSVQLDKTMKLSMPGGCNSCLELQRGINVDCLSRKEFYRQRLAGHNGTRVLYKVWESVHGRTQLLRAGVSICKPISGLHSVRATENGLIVGAKHPSITSGLYPERFWKQRAGYLSLDAFRGFASARASNYGRSSGRVMAATESTGTFPLTEDTAIDVPEEQTAQTEEQTRKKQEKKEQKKRAKVVKKLMKQQVKEELKRFFAEALERQHELKDDDSEAENSEGDVGELEEKHKGDVVEVHQEVQEEKKTVTRKVKTGLTIRTLGSHEEQPEDDVTDGEQDVADVEQDGGDTEDEDADLREDEIHLEVLDNVEVDVMEKNEEVETAVRLESATVTQDEVIDDEVEDEMGDEDDFWDDDAYPQDPVIGDGEDGGGTVLDDAEWGKAALNLAVETLEKNFSSDFSIFGFKLSKDAGLIRVRLDKLTDKYGSPTMDDIERFSSIYGKRLDEEGLANRLPDNLALEVSSPGAERVVRVPQDLVRFKELPMYVRYTVEGGAEDSVKDGIWQVDTVEEDKAVWKLANVRANREVAGKGRPLNKKQKDWRFELPFSNTQLVRLYLDV